MTILPEHSAQMHASSKGTLYIWRPAPTMLVTRSIGVLTEACGEIIASAAQRTVAEDGRMLGFHDWEETTDYELAARARLTAIAVSMLNSFDGAHFLLRSKVVAFGVQVAGAILKKLTIHPSRDAFERALEDAMRERHASGMRSSRG